MWHNHPNYWRGRYDADNDRLIFEYIDEDDLAGTWTENVNARIDCSGFDVGVFPADFTVRGVDASIPTTIHYSAGIDTWVAESDEATTTGWAWENLTKVFEGTAPNWYQRVNLAANRQTPGPKLYASAVFSDDSEGTEHVVYKKQLASGNITGWNVTVDVSDNTNTNKIYGETVRSIGDAGGTKDDVLFLYKEGDAIKSQYFSGALAQGIQTVDATAYSGKTMFDMEHSLDSDARVCNVIYVDADGTIKWAEREQGNTTAWSAISTLDSDTDDHGDVGICERGDGLNYIFWKEGNKIQYRIHRHTPEIWVPTLGNAPSEFDPATEAVIDTTTVVQTQSPDGVHNGHAVPLCWIGKIGADNCEIGWGLLVAASNENYTRGKELTLPTDDSNLTTAFLPSEYVDVATDDDVFVEQCARDALDPYGIFVWKDKHTTNTKVILSTCKLKTSIAPSTSAVYLQIYNQTDDVWETLDSDGATIANTEFTLSGTQSNDLSKYYSDEFWVHHRIYQETSQ